MEQVQKIKFASMLSEDVLTQLKTEAKEESRPMWAILEEALKEYFARKEAVKADQEVLEALKASMSENDWLYRELAK